MRFTDSYKFRFTVASSFFIIAVSIIIACLAVGKIKSAASHAFSGLGTTAIKRAQQKIDPDAFLRLAKSMDKNDSYYQELAEELRTIRYQNQCKFLYTIIPSGNNTFTYIVDGSSIETDSENFSPIGTSEDFSKRGIYPQKALETKEITASDIEKHEKKGWIITFYAPIINNDESIGLIACEFNVQSINNLINGAKISMLVSTVLVAAVCIILLYLYIASFFKKLDGISKRMNEIAGGESDLTARIMESGENELAVISKACNSIMEKLQEMIIKEKEALFKLNGNSKTLLEQNKETISLIEKSVASMDDIDEQARNQSYMTKEANESIENVMEAVINLEEKTQKQMEAIHNSSEAVTQILHNIEDVNEKISEISGEYENIVLKSQDGRERQTEVTQKIEIIEEMTKKLYEANRVISEISARTNLLSMNAAIEAAHAGAAGQGFSVVANEIRNLATNSAAQTKSIKELVKDIETAVKQMVEASSNSTKSFDALEHSIQTMDESLQTVRIKINEQNMESNKIHDMMDVLKTSSEAISISSGQVTAKNYLLEQQIAVLQQKAGEILGISIEATDDLGKMKDFATKAEIHSEENMDLTHYVKELVDTYKTE